jgi:MFS family permease
MSFTSRWGDVYLAAGARAVSSCGDFLAATTLVLALQQAGAGGLAVSGLLLAASLPLAVLAPITGRIADRVDSRTVLVVAGIAQAAVCVVLAFATHPALIVGLVGLLACGLAVTQPTLAALLPEMVRRGDLARASGINQTAGMIGMLVAPALAGVLVGQFGTRLPLLLDAGSYLGLVVAGILIRTRRSGPRAQEKTPVAWRLRDDRLVATMVAALAACIAGVGAVNVVEVFFIRETLGSTATVFGLVAASWTAGMIIGALALPRLLRRYDDPRPIAKLNMWLMAVCCVQVMLGAGVWHALLLVPLWLLGGICNGGLNVAMNVVMAARVPAFARGRAFASMGSAVQGAGVFGFLIGGPLVDRVEPRVLLVAFGAAGVLAVLACVPSVRRAVRSGPPADPLPDGELLVGDSVGS